MIYAAVGDIHGDGGKLDDMMDALAAKMNFDVDTVVFLGDYIDGGPESAYVVDLLRRLETIYPHWKFLMGNHEDMMLDALLYKSMTYGNFYQWWNQGGEGTYMSYDPTHVQGARPPLPQQIVERMGEDIEWLKSLPFFYDTEHFFFVHAGVEPYTEPFETKFEDMLWLRSNFIKSDYDWGKRIIFGHTAHSEPLVMPNKIGIDTMHHGRGKLSAVILDSNQTMWYDLLQV